MTNPELPDTGTNETPDVISEQAIANETLGDTAFASANDDAMDEHDVSEENFADEDDNFEDEDLDAEDEELDEAEAEAAPRSLMEDLFDEDELFEELSELDVLTLEEAATYLKVEYGAIRRMLKEQGLPGRKIGNEWRFLRGAIADWLRNPGGVETAVAPTAPAPQAAARPKPAERPAQPERVEQRPQREDRREFTQRPPFRERFSQDNAEGGQRFPQQGGSRYPQQQGGSRYPQQGGSRYPQKRPPFQAEGQQEGGYSEGRGQGGYQGGGQGGYPPPRRPSFGNDQQQFPQGEYRPPPRRPPFRAGQEGNSGDQAGGNYAGGGSYGGQRFSGGPKKPKRKALNEQRFKRIDRRKFGEEAGEAGPADAGDE